MRIISWNVNSIRARVENFSKVIDNYNPDIFLLQETRVEDSLFPQDFIEERGYNIAFKGQKGRNGVAICSKHILEEVSSDFCEEARYIEAFSGGVFISSVYVPNGQEVDTDAYYYKLDFLKQLKQKFQAYRDEVFVFGGDFNVGPYPCDIYIKGYDGIAGSERERIAIEELRNIGYKDELENCGFTWWSYRQRGFKKDNGFRLDHFYLSHKAHQLYVNGGVLRDVREYERPSDHAPIFCELIEV